jgi:hypothetical protein
MGLSIINVHNHTRARVPLRIDYLDSVSHILPILCDIQGVAPRQRAGTVFRFRKVKLPRPKPGNTLRKPKLRQRGNRQAQHYQASQQICGAPFHHVPPGVISLRECPPEFELNFKMLPAVGTPRCRWQLVIERYIDFACIRKGRVMAGYGPLPTTACAAPCPQLAKADKRPLNSPIVLRCEIPIR